MTASFKVLFTAIILLIISTSTLLAQNSGKVADARIRWVDSVYNALNDTERIGQLFMIAAYSGGKDYNEDTVTKMVERGQVGGLIFMQGTAEAQATQNNTYQRLAKVPLMIGMDAEWGLGMRLTGVKDLPRQMMIGATMDTLLAYRMGVAVAAQCNRMGVHINFAPVVDVNNNPNNPIINARSFGEDKEWVAKLGIAYMRGMQDNGVMACAKHFPGHGDTETDSHKDLPTITKTLEQLEALELYPFRRLMNAGVKSMMVAHLDIPALEKELHIPTTLSNNTINNYLKTKMGFTGLVFTDALNMEGVAKYFKPGDVDLRAFIAGNDVLLFSQNVPVAIAKIQEAINDDRISKKELELRVKKILAAKYDLGLHAYKEIKSLNATQDLNKSTESVLYQMAEASVTFVRDRNQLLNKFVRKSGTVSYIGVNAKDTSSLLNSLKKEIPGIQSTWLAKGSSAGAVSSAVNAVNGGDICIVAVHNMGFYPSGGDYGLDAQQMSFLKQVQSKPNVILALMGNPYLLQNFCSFKTVFVGYEDNPLSEKIMADVMLGVMPAKGKLPVTACPGMTMEAPPKLLADKPKPVKDPVVDKLVKTFFIEDAGVVNRDALDKLNIFLERSVIDGVFPGCQVMAAKNGKVFYNRAFGYYDAYKKTKVDTNSIYDVASLTKVLATTLAVMQLYEDKKLDLNKTLVQYLPWVAGTDKETLVIRDLLLHQAGLKSWIPFYKETIDSATAMPDSTIYSITADNTFSIPVAKNLYMHKGYRDTIWKSILTTPLENKGRYVYSDLDFYFLAAVVEKLTGKNLDTYVEEEFYKPMGLKNICYNPLSRFSVAKIVPTENDNYFRMQTIRGYVHDQGAAMLGGVGGHAGLFANAEDVAAIFQMLLQGGTYNGKRFFKKETVGYFTAYNSRLSRRGLGFDKPEADADDAGPTGDRSSGYTFGHQGFTGTCAWADPETGVVFVFLSNRVNPSAENKKINSQSTRTVVQDYIYESLGLPINRNRANVKREQLSKSH